MVANPQGRPPRAVLDTNVLISAYVFGGKPEKVLKRVVGEEVQGIISQVLVSELLDVLRKKFRVPKSKILEMREEIEDAFEMVFPIETLKITEDDDDNRVLEAAADGKCNYIVTGDRDLLDLGKYKRIKIITPADFLKIFEPIEK